LRNPELIKYVYHLMGHDSLFMQQSCNCCDWSFVFKRIEQTEFQIYFPYIYSLALRNWNSPTQYPPVPLKIFIFM
jgi:hypothetical protein